MMADPVDPVKPKTGDVDLLIATGSRLAREGDVDGAARFFGEAVLRDPSSAVAHCNLGLVRLAQGRLGEAVDSLRNSVRIDPELAAGWLNLGLAWTRQGALDEAEAALERALAIEPTFAEAHFALGGLHERRGQLVEAATVYETALALRPNYGKVSNNLGNVRKALGDFAGAEVSYRQALAADRSLVEAELNLGILRLLQGDFGAGWPLYQARLRVPGVAPKPLPSPPWDGGDLSGKTILLSHEQGFGDSIQFSRFIGAVARRGPNEVLLSAPVPLHRLFAALPARLVSNDDPLPPHDVHAFLPSLPSLLGVSAAEMASARYLSARPEEVSRWHSRLARLSGVKLGVVWRGRPQHPGDALRSIAATTLRACLDVPGLSVVSLQPDASHDELEALGARFNAGAAFNDFADTAACIEALDLVLTVDTAVCHLAGALGAPVWTLIPFAPDWRWLTERDDSPWYASMRLFRQPNHGAWADVLRRVRRELSTLAT